MFKTCCVDQEDLMINVHAPDSIWRKDFLYRLRYIKGEDGSLWVEDGCFMCGIFGKGKRE